MCVYHISSITIVACVSILQTHARAYLAPQSHTRLSLEDWLNLMVGILLLTTLRLCRCLDLTAFLSKRDPQCPYSLCYPRFIPGAL